mgnify:CR=1 FL=1
MTLFHDDVPDDEARLVQLVPEGNLLAAVQCNPQERIHGKSPSLCPFKMSTLGTAMNVQQSRYPCQAAHPYTDRVEEKLPPYESDELNQQTFDRKCFSMSI